MIPFTDEVDASVIAFENSRGQRLFGLRCDPCEKQSKGLVLLPPGYERRIHHYSVLSRYLIRHNYSTVRFDYANHIGMSDGEVIDFTLSSMADDVASVASACLARFPQPRWIVASSLGARAVIRALAGDTAIQSGYASTTLILPVIDAEATITVAIGWDSFDDWRSGRITDPDTARPVLNHVLRYEFVRDALVSNFAGVEPTLAEFASIVCPIFTIAAEKDDWVDMEDVRRAMAAEAPGARSTVILEATSHDLSNNPPAMRTLMEEVLGAIAESSGNEAGPVSHLDFDEVFDTIQHEREWKNNGYSALRPATEQPLSLSVARVEQ